MVESNSILMNFPFQWSTSTLPRFLKTIDYIHEIWGSSVNRSTTFCFKDLFSASIYYYYYYLRKSSCYSFNWLFKTSISKFFCCSSNILSFRMSRFSFLSLSFSWILSMMSMQWKGSIFWTKFYISLTSLFNNSNSISALFSTISSSDIMFN